MEILSCSAGRHHLFTYRDRPPPCLQHCGFDPTSMSCLCKCEYGMTQTSMMLRIGFGSILSPWNIRFSFAISSRTPWNLNNSDFSMGWDLTGTELGSQVQSWSCSSKLSPTRYAPSCNVSLKPLLAQALLVSHHLPHPALKAECLPHFSSPTGGWGLCLSTRTPLLDPAGTSSPLPRARRSFHCIFAVPTPFSLCYCWPLPDCQSGSGQQCSSFLVSFNNCVWIRLLAGECGGPQVTQHACCERMSGVRMKPMAPAVRLQHREGFQLPIKSSWWISVASRRSPLHHDQYLVHGAALSFHNNHFFHRPLQRWLCIQDQEWNHSSLLDCIITFCYSVIWLWM